ncbi:pyruvate kinase [Candidatus Woesearchaeota archaeon]|nr:pyruvate kinase [Candidatus Woesearchaeota archaeon]
MRTKIVATVGPSCESVLMLSRLVDAGTDLFRLNTKHNTLSWHSMMIDRIKSVGRQRGKKQGIILDLQGSEICTGSFEGGQIQLNDRDLILITDKGDIGNESRIILKDSGVLKAIRGGVLFDRRSVNLPETIIDLPVLTMSDKEFVNLGIQKGVDFFALSFVRNSKDIMFLRKMTSIKIISKIERAQAISNFPEILSSSDAIMIGRGDLGVEIPLPLVPLVQKDLIQQCRESGKPVITATQMLESMIKSRMPTRAEVSDVANAVLDGTDAIMLSAESATGRYPVEAVKMMGEIDRAVQSGSVRPARLQYRKPVSLIEAISQAVDTLSSNPLDFKAIVLLTETGRTARMIARFRPGLPIYAVTENDDAARALNLVWGVNASVMKFGRMESEKAFVKVISELKRKKKVSAGDNIICVSGQIIGKENMVNSIVINKVE